MNFSTKPKNTHLPQVEKFYLKNFKPFMPKSGIFLNNKMKKPNKIKELQTVKNTKERSTKIWQDLSKNILLTNIQEFP